LNSAKAQFRLLFFPFVHDRNANGMHFIIHEPQNYGYSKRPFMVLYTYLANIKHSLIPVVTTCLNLHVFTYT
jgi:hypothetical protein